jgi:outer membrane protein TolC
MPLSLKGNFELWITEYSPMYLSRKITVLISFAALASCSIAPKPTTYSERVARLQHDKAHMYQGQARIGRRMCIYEAVARSVKYNFEHQAKTFEAAIANTDLKSSEYSMLPDIVATAGYHGRSNSREVLSPSSGTASTSEDRFRHTESLELSWNILDFGISYYVSRQKGNHYLMTQEVKRKTLQNLVQNTRNQFWRAHTAQKMLPMLPPLLRKIKRTVTNSWEAQKEKLVAPNIAARYRLELWENYHKINSIEHNLSDAKPRLKQNISAPWNAKFKLIANRKYLGLIPKDIPKNLAKLERLALLKRPEIRQEEYQEKIKEDDIHKARLAILPGVPLKFGAYHDSNSFLLNKDWIAYSAQLVLNIMKLPQKFLNLSKEKQAKKLADMKRYALSAMIITEVDISQLQYKFNKKNVFISKRIYENAKEVYFTMKKKARTNLAAEMDLIRARIKYIETKIRYELSKVELENSAGKVLVSLGYDPLNTVDSTEIPLKQLTREVKRSMTQGLRYPSKKRRVQKQRRTIAKYRPKPRKARRTQNSKQVSEERVPPTAYINKGQGGVTQTSISSQEQQEINALVDKLTDDGASKRMFSKRTVSYFHKNSQNPFEKEKLKLVKKELSNTTSKRKIDKIINMLREFK